jgi:hypothetical protein
MKPEELEVFKTMNKYLSLIAQELVRIQETLLDMPRPARKRNEKHNRD